METPVKHPVLPKSFALGSTELARWISDQSVTSFKHEIFEYLEPQEIQQFEHESSVNGREFNRLNAIKQRVADIVRKGSDKETVIKIPASVGTKLLEIQRRQNDDMIETGATKFEIDVFQIPDLDTAKFEFFDSEGNHFPDRTRDMSISERNKHIGISNQLYIKQQDNGSVVDESTGEILKDGTNN